MTDPSLLRRRTSVLAVIAAVVVVLAVGVAVRATRGTDDGAARGHRDANADRLIGHATPLRLAVDGRGDLLTIWTTCPDGQLFDKRCPFAWRLSTRNGTVSTGGLAANSFPQVSGGPRGFAVLGAHGVALAVRPDGSTAPLRRVAPGPITAHAVYVAPYGAAAIADVSAGTWSPLGDGARLGNGVLSGGKPWALDRATAAGHAVHWRDGARWSRHPLPSTPGTLAVHGTHAVATSTRVSDDVAMLRAWSVTTDGGRTWRDLPGARLPFHDAASLAVGPDGTLYVASTVDGLFRSTGGTWTRFAKVAGVAHVRQLAATPSGVAALVGGSTPRIVAVTGASVKDWPTALR